MLLRTLRKVGPWLAFVIAWIIAHNWMSDIAATGLALVVWVLAKVFVGSPQHLKLRFVRQSIVENPSGSKRRLNWLRRLKAEITNE